MFYAGCAKCPVCRARCAVPFGSGISGMLYCKLKEPVYSFFRQGTLFYTVVTS